MESPLSDSFTFPGNRLTSYIQTLTETKKGLPHGIPVCVCASHTITTTNALVQLASSIGPHIAILKVFADIIDDWSDDTVHQLIALARQHAFLIWEGGRILNSTVDVTGTSESKEVRNELVDLVRRKYTKGVIKTAAWAGIATAWASGVAEDNQEADILIPALKAAARETVANTTQTIRTEITAEKSPNNCPSHDNAEDDDPQHLTSDYVVVDNENLGLPLRKASTISLTQTITQHTEDSTEDFTSLKSDRSDVGDHLSVNGGQKRPSITPDDDAIPPPPLLARGLVLCLPSEYTDAFTPDYRRSCLAAARANQDFVIGFLLAGQWHLVSQREDLLDMEIPEYDNDLVQEQQPVNDWDEDKPYHLAVFSLISHRLNQMHGKHLEDYNDEDEENEPLSPTTPIVNTSSADVFNPLSTKLESIVGQALKMRDAIHDGNEVTNEQTNNDTKKLPRVMHIPIVSLP
ncbi:hypothetical protein SI65_08293 [Aspergillus cristatus]|uniref:Uncharacterized protein n=1 Tax=Aspergillus cristatus TaxID=573508 RepID=A0A1E3B5U5_ASPCR|nr:hypothetical protein SI65_08293 [Aspergillus cristatus]